MTSLPELSVNCDPVHINGSDSKEKESVSKENSKTVKCTICTSTFFDLKECLKHELLHHGSKKATRPQKFLRNKINSVITNLKINDEKSFHSKLIDELHKSQPGRELSNILKRHRMNDENLGLVYERIYTCLKKELQRWKNIKIHPFGSFVSGLALRDSDIDLFIECEPSTREGYQKMMFNTINNILRRSKSFSEVFAIRHARVPIIKCKHTSTGFSLDINLSCQSSVQNTNFLRDLLNLDTRLMDLTVFLKVWAKQLQLIGRGNMTSYGFITLIIFYLQQPQSEHPAVLPSIKKLQENLPAVMIEGVNYAYELHRSTLSLSRKLTTSRLIKGFFKFYSNFEFEKFLIAPYLGEAVPIDQFKDDTFSYPAYHNQLHAISLINNTPVEPFPSDCCVCVQDPFSLNYNVGKSVIPLNLEYIRDCIKHACNIYEDESISTDAQRYEALLYGIIERIMHTANVNSTSIKEIMDNKTSTMGVVTHGKELSYRFTPSRSEIQAISAHDNELSRKSLHELWVKYYLEVISEIIKDIYCLDLEAASPAHSNKHQRLEETDRTYTWLLSGSIDQWTGRVHQRCKNTDFMKFHLEQTKKFAAERRQNSIFAVEISATLTMNIYNPTAIELIVTSRRANDMRLIKKNPLCKFFMMLKCSMQNFSLKEWLQTKVPKNRDCPHVD